MSVLILEDNRQILKVLEELVLSVSDEKVYATDDVGEAYKIAMENSVDVFLLDIILYADKKARRFYERNMFSDFTEFMEKENNMEIAKNDPMYMELD